ncbi:uncharacterized protein [Phaseolus vulgaris]|uniref:uncharacterized protein n=1 Tax=Phaseolus vulgaris TaxID=3885 RepID=UPI0035CA247E
MAKRHKEVQKRIDVLDARDDDRGLVESEREERKVLLADLIEVKWRRARNQVHGIYVNDKWCDDKSVIKDKVQEFFDVRFAKNDACQVCLDNVRFRSISDSDNDLLIGDFSEEEIRDAVWSCDNSKSPGPVGFNFGFLKFGWDIIKKDVMAAVKDFAVNGHWPRGTNALFLCFIPKVENPQQLGEFRPISLVGCMYKTISKALSLRLKKVIGKVIDVRQSTFLEGRGLLDNVLVANEVLEEYKRKRKSCVVFKVDYELLVNGCPTKEFFPMKGLRQGDPLAPFLFLLVAEGLAKVSRMAEEKNLIDSLEVGRDRVKVNMLQYVDDTLFFCEANTKSIFNIKAILQCFELASRLRVNFVKSRIGGMGLSHGSLRSFANILKRDVMGSPFVYLGLPVGGSHKRSDFWNGVIEKVKTRLSRWKDKLVRIQRDFLWGWGSEGRKIAWTSWEKVCKPRELGGLGIIDLKTFNVALLGKWIWRLGSDKDGLWKEILVSKYGGWRSLREEEKSSRCSLWWKDLKKVWVLEGWGSSFEEGISWKVGDGNDLYQALLEVRLVMGEADRWVWKAGGLQTFSVSSAYSLLRRDGEVVFSSTYSKLWSCKVVPSALVTAWRVLENKIATRANLERRGVLVGSPLCCLCGKEEESYRHLFFDCRFAWWVWCLCLEWLGVAFVSHIDPVLNFAQFRMCQSSKSVNEVWRTIWVGVVGEIWIHRNFIIFNRGVADASELCARVQTKVYLEMQSWTLVLTKVIGVEASKISFAKVEKLKCEHLESTNLLKETLEANSNLEERLKLLKLTRKLMSRRFLDALWIPFDNIDFGTNSSEYSLCIHTAFSVKLLRERIGTLFPDEKSENPNGVQELHHQNDVDAGALFVLKSEGFILYYVSPSSVLRLLRKNSLETE